MPKQGGLNYLISPMFNLRRPIRVLHVLENLSLAGLEYGVIKQVNRLDRRAFSPMIGCLRYQYEETRSLIDEKIPIFELRKKPGREFPVIFRLAALLRNQRVDIVHSHNWRTFFYTVVASMLARTPVLVHGEHGREEATVPKRQQFIQGLMGPLVDSFVTVSSSLGKEMADIFKSQPEKIVTIPNGVNLESFRQTYQLDSIRKELQISPDNLVILTVGGLRPVKDHQTLIRAFFRIQRDLPMARLLIVGTDHGKGFQEKLETLCQQLGDQNSILFTGIRHDIPQLMQLSNVYVNSSLFEGMSNTILEAMAAGCPVIGTQVGGNPELIEDKVTGYLFAPKDETQLSEQLKELLLNPALAKKMAANGQRRVEQHHSMSGMIKRYESLYREIWWKKSQASHPLKKNTKQILARGLRWSGLNVLKSMTSMQRLTILTYHRVLPVEEASSYPFQGMVVPRDVFEAQVAYLAKSYTVLNFKQAIEGLRERKLPKNAVVVTFDDGYRDNYEIAFPILKKYQIPAIFFVVTGAVDQSVRIWWDEVAEAMKYLSLRSSLSREEMAKFPEWVNNQVTKLSNGFSYQYVANELVHALNNVALEERQGIRNSLLELVNGNMSSIQEMMLTWDQIKVMHHSGMSFGAHSHTHAFLDELNEADAQWEIQECVDSLERMLHTPVRFFAYPRGRYTDRIRPLLNQAGIQAAVTTDEGQNRSTADLFKLKRLDAGYCCIEAEFDKSIFEIELKGWFSPLRK